MTSTATRGPEAMGACCSPRLNESNQRTGGFGCRIFVRRPGTHSLTHAQTCCECQLIHSPPRKVTDEAIGDEHEAVRKLRHIFYVAKDVNGAWCSRVVVLNLGCVNDSLVFSCVWGSSRRDLSQGFRVACGGDIWLDRKSTRLNSSHSQQSRMPSSA